MRERSWRRKQNHKNRGKNHGCGCGLCKPWKHGKDTRAADLEKTALKIEALNLKYMGTNDE